MIVLTPNNFSDYKLLDTGDGERLEKFGEFILRRPDPQIIWKRSLPPEKWEKYDAIFTDKWSVKTSVPKQWLLTYGDIKFYCKLSPFKHTGVFPEQAVHWEFIERVVSHQTSEVRQAHILNLFGYTGIASLIASQAGAKVTHVDASYPTIGWFQENIKASGLEGKPIRWIEDDVLKFCQRELKRGNKYDGIIMDPPSFGHGPKGETWKFNEHFPKLLAVCSELLVEKPLFVIANAYAISSSSLALENVFKDFLKDLDGTIESGELALKEESSERLLSTGIFCRWSK